MDLRNGALGVYWTARGAGACRSFTPDILIFFGSQYSFLFPNVATEVTDHFVFACSQENIMAQYKMFVLLCATAPLPALFRQRREQGPDSDFQIMHLQQRRRE